MVDQPPHSGLFVFCLLLSSAALSEAVGFNWPVHANASGKWLKAAIGTPPQFVRLALGDLNTGDDLRVSNATYDHWRSTTYEWEGIFYANEPPLQLGVKALESFVVGDDGVSFRKKPFRVINAALWTGGRPTVGWRRPTDGSDSFVTAVLREVDEPVVVFSFDRPKRNGDPPISGVVTFGTPPAARCAPDWKFVHEIPYTASPELPNQPQWTLNVTEFSFGDFSYEAAGQLLVSVEEERLVLPARYRDDFLHLLGATNETTVPCDSRVDLRFAFGPLELRVTADEYVDRTNQPHGTCGLHVHFAEISDREFGLSAAVFARYCLLLDYAHARVGFATRR
ncbi:hypothetical protein M3Y99_01675700 [Aphelenchoides fujianensis]|nr:hypothetical protein M3Y99_01675700 [Aphelenchoides fujianensis]